MEGWAREEGVKCKSYRGCSNGRGEGDESERRGRAAMHTRAEVTFDICFGRNRPTHIPASGLLSWRERILDAPR